MNRQNLRGEAYQLLSIAIGLPSFFFGVVLLLFSADKELLVLRTGGITTGLFFAVFGYMMVRSLWRSNSLLRCFCQNLRIPFFLSIAVGVMSLIPPSPELGNISPAEYIICTQVIWFAYIFDCTFAFFGGRLGDLLERSIFTNKAR